MHKGLIFDTLQVWLLAVLQVPASRLTVAGLQDDAV